MLLNKVKAYIKSEELLHHSTKILVGVSGGADSMVLLEILHQLNYTCTVAHMNFSLRGNDSDEDEAFVRAHALQRNIPFYAKKVDTLNYAKSKGISMEMAARELRYTFFDALIHAHNLDVIAVGHHKNDLVETMLINLTRGTGVRGLTSIKPKTDKIIRPLLPCTNQEIIAFTKQHKITYRTDKTNTDTRIKRNNFRHNIIPKFEEVNPSFIQTMADTAHRMQQVQLLINDVVKCFTAKYVEQKNGKTYIHLNGLIEHASQSILLFEMLNPLGFNASQLEEIANALPKEPGKTWQTRTYRLILSSTHLILQHCTALQNMGEVKIDADTRKISSPIHLTLSNKLLTKDCTLIFSAENVYFDAEKIHFPLTLRKWKQGDWFVPFGMTGRKKLSDFFIDKKLSLDEKEEVYVLLSGEDIIWVLGLRTDNRYKITPKTVELIHIKLDKNNTEIKS